jgi:hypothetical protein
MDLLTVDVLLACFLAAILVGRHAGHDFVRGQRLAGRICDTGCVSGVCACAIARPLKQQTNASIRASIAADFIPRTSSPAITHFAEEKFAS